jgi:hypothetical protein
LNIFETMGLCYTILATTLFTIELICCSAKGLSALRHLLARGQGAPEKREAPADKSRDYSRDNVRDNSKGHVVKLPAPESRSF